MRLKANSDKTLIEMSARLQMEGLGHIVTVSAGALALLVTFRSNLVGEGARWVVALRVSWIGLALAVLLAVLCKMLASDAISSLLSAETRTTNLDSKLDRADFLSMSSLICFGVGVVGLAVFGVANL